MDFKITKTSLILTVTFSCLKPLFCSESLSHESTVVSGMSENNSAPREKGS